MTRLLLAISSRRVSGLRHHAVQRNGSGLWAILISEVEVADGLKAFVQVTQTIKGVCNGLVLRNQKNRRLKRRTKTN